MQTLDGQMTALKRRGLCFRSRQHLTDGGTEGGIRARHNDGRKTETKKSPLKTKLGRPLEESPSPKKKKTAEPKIPGCSRVRRKPTSGSRTSRILVARPLRLSPSPRRPGRNDKMKIKGGEMDGGMERGREAAYASVMNAQVAVGSDAKTRPRNQKHEKRRPGRPFTAFFVSRIAPTCCTWNRFIAPKRLEHIQLVSPAGRTASRVIGRGSYRNV